MPMLFHDKKHSPLEDRNCNCTTCKTYVDDSFLLVKKEENVDIRDMIIKNIEKTADYLINYRMAVNEDKTNIMIITKNKNVMKQFEIKIKDKSVKHSKTMTILGNTINDKLNWNNMTSVGTDALLNQLKIRNHTLSKIVRYLDPKMK